jgi:hypothetical protein
VQPCLSQPPSSPAPDARPRCYLNRLLLHWYPGRCTQHTCNPAPAPWPPSPHPIINPPRHHPQGGCMPSPCCRRASSKHLLRRHTAGWRSRCCGRSGGCRCRAGRWGRRSPGENQGQQQHGRPTVRHVMYTCQAFYPLVGLVNSSRAFCSLQQCSSGSVNVYLAGPGVQLWHQLICAFAWITTAGMSSQFVGTWLFTSNSCGC